MATKPKRRLRESPKAFRKPIQWQVDSDYLDKLSPKDREWMLKFQEAEYGGNGHLMHKGKKECRRLWVNQKKQQRDAMTYARFSDTGEPPDGRQPSPEDAIIEAMDRRSEAEAQEAIAKRKASIEARRKRLDALDRAEAKRKAKARSKRLKLAADTGTAQREG